MIETFQDQIVILHVDYLPRQRTEAQFVALLQPAHSNRITLEHILSSDVVKNILSAQLRPLARVLGGVHIERLQLASVERRPTQSQNHRLYMLLLCAGIGLLFCYTIACFKVIRYVMALKNCIFVHCILQGRYQEAAKSQSNDTRRRGDSKLWNVCRLAASQMRRAQRQTEGNCKPLIQRLQRSAH